MYPYKAFPSRVSIVPTGQEDSKKVQMNIQTFSTEK
jgi:hypothetical protein